MLLLLIIYFISNTTAKVFFYPGEHVDNGVISSNGLGVFGTDNIYNIGNIGRQNIIGEPLWILRLNNYGWTDPELTLGTSADLENFYNAVSPMIRRSSSRQTFAKVLKRNNSSETQNVRSNEDLKKDILKIINKFVLHTSEEPDSYLTGKEDEKDPTVALYFQGSLTCVIVILGDKQWHYLLDYVAFPDWFYQPHDTFNAPLKIPEDIKNPFFHKLLRVLTLLLYHPL